MDPILRIGGLEKFSAVDWPGRLAATVFCQGCGWRCRYCHNAHLIPFRSGPVVEGGWTWPAVLAWLRGRRGLLDAVVFSGGEPTLQPGLGSAMRQARELGFSVGLHTGGPSPESLAAVLPSVDWVGFDFKAPFDAYQKVTGRGGGAAAERSFQLLRASGVDCEIRTTWHPALLSENDLATMADTLVAAGRWRWVLQMFRPEGCVDVELREAPTRSVPPEIFERSDLRVCVR